MYLPIGVIPVSIESPHPGFSRQSLAANVTEAHPPAFIMQAENDPFGAQSKA